MLAPFRAIARNLTTSHFAAATFPFQRNHHLPASKDMNPLFQNTSRTAAKRHLITQATRKASTSASHQAVVIGSGPAGVTALGNLLDQGIEDVLMVDPHFNGGRLNERYRNVPSNTKGACVLSDPHSILSLLVLWLRLCVIDSENIHRLGKGDRHLPVDH